MTKEQKIEALIKECNQLKIKADKWDKLEEQIAACYGKEENGEWEENDDPDIDLGTIGELAATAFGWL